MNDFDFEPGFPMLDEFDELCADGFVSFETDATGEQRVVLTELGRIALSIGDQTTSLPSG